MSRRGLFLALLLAFLALAPWGTAPASADSGPVETFVSLYAQASANYDGNSSFFDSSNSTIYAYMNGSAVEVDVAGKTQGEGAQLIFSPPQGQQLHAGDYSPGPHLSGGWLYCAGPGSAWGNGASQFRVQQITTDGSGNLTSFSATFEEYCNGYKPLIGEVRFNVAGDGGAAVVTPQDVWSIPLQRDSGAVSIPVTTWNPGSTSIHMDSSSLSGPDAAKYKIASDDCAGVTLAAGAQCTVTVTFDPTSSGSTQATLSVPEHGGFVHSVTLEDDVPSGDSFAAVANDSTTSVYPYFFQTSPAGVITATMTSNGNEVDVLGRQPYPDDNGFEFTFQAPTGQQLSTGHYSVADGAYLRIATQGGCDYDTGNFDVKQLTTDDQGNVTSLLIDFESVCAPSPAAEGVVAYDSTAVTDPLVVLPTHIGWPDTPTFPAHPPKAQVTAWNVSSDSVDVGQASLSGPNAADDVISADSCSGTTVAPGDTCTVALTFQPQAAGDSHATFNLPEASGPDHSTTLEGTGFSTDTWISTASQPGDPVGGGQSHFFDPANSTIAAYFDSRQLVVSATPKDSSRAYTFVFTPPNSYPGFWPGQDDEFAQQVTDGSPILEGIPGIDISAGGTDCTAAAGEVIGRFQINQLTTDGDGNITTLDITYEQYCGDASKPLTGEIQYQMPPNGGNMTVGPLNVWWPSLKAGQPAADVPVTAWNSSANPVEMGTSSIIGDAKADDAIVSDGCAGKTIQPGGECQVVVSTTQLGPGARFATLSVPEEGGFVHSVSLGGLPQTRLSYADLISEPGDNIGQGHDLFMGGADATVSASISSDHNTLTVDASSGAHAMTLTLVGPGNPDLLDGGPDYTGARPLDAAAKLGQPGIAVEVDGQTCEHYGGHFRIHQISWDAEGNVTKLWVTFGTSCGGALLGDIRINMLGGDSGFVGPEDVWFPDLATGSSPMSVPVTVMNPGPGPIDIGTASLDGSGYSIASDGCSGTTVAGGDTCQITVTETPGPAGSGDASLSGTLTIPGAGSVSLEGLVRDLAPTLVTLESLPGDSLGQGQNVSFVPNDSTVSATMSDDGSSVTVHASNGSHDFSMTFATGDGTPLQPGAFYLHATDAGTAGAAMMQVSGDGNSCNADHGRFRVQQILTNSDGDIYGFWIDFEQFCDGSSQPLLGEIRFQTPPPSGPLVVGPSQFWWPDVPANGSPITVPVVVMNPGPNPIDVSASSVSGLNATDDTIVSDGCAGQTLASGQQCQVMLSYLPTSPDVGVSHATLTVPQADGPTYTVSLDGSVLGPSVAVGGQTYASFGATDYNHPDGESLFFVSPSDTASTTVSGTDSTVTATVTTLDSVYTITVGAPEGQVLHPGDYPQAAHPVGSVLQPSIQVAFADNYQCRTTVGNFRIHELDTDFLGNVTSLWMDFAAQCLGSGRAVEPTLEGEIRYNVPDDVGSGPIVAPREVSWTDSSTTTQDVTVWNPGPGSLQVGASSISGPDAAANTIAADGCDGATLAPGDTCTISVAYDSSQAVSGSATLTVPSGGATRTVALDGSVPAGLTDFSITGGDGGGYDFDPSDATFQVFGSYNQVDLTWTGDDGGEWWARFAAPAGQQLTPGTTYTAAVPYGGGSTPTLNIGWYDEAAGVTASSGSCFAAGDPPSFTVTDIYVDPTGQLQRFGVEFNQPCDPNPSFALTGTLDYQVNDMSAAAFGLGVHVAGTVSPNEPGQTVKVELLEKRGRKFLPLRTKVLTLNRKSAYKTRFDRPRRHGACRAIAIFSAKDKHLASRTVRSFHC